MAMGDEEPAEQLDPTRVSLKVSTLKREPSVPAAAPQDIPRASTGQGGFRDIRRAEAHDKSGQGLGHSSLSRAYPRQAEEAGHFDQALQDALSNPKHRMLVLRLEGEVRDFVQSTRSTLVYGESLNGFQRLLAHRVSYFYGLETCKAAEGVHQGKILATRTSWTRLPLVKLADAVKVVERSRGGPDASRTYTWKDSMGSKNSTDSSSGKGMAVSSSREGMALSKTAAVDALEKPKVQSHKGQKGDREITAAAAPAVAPLRLQTRPSSERQRDIERAKARTFSDSVPVPQHRHASGSRYSSSSPGGGGLLEKSLERTSEAASRGSPASEGGHAGRGHGSKKGALLRTLQTEPAGWTSLQKFPSGELGMGQFLGQRSLSSEHQQLGVGAAATQLPLLPAAPQQRAGHLSDTESHSGSARSTRSPRGVPPPPQVMMPMQADRAPGHFLPAGNVPQMSAYGQPMQIPPGYAFVPAHPQMPGMPMYGQGHLVPIGNFAMQPQQPYGYVAPAAQGMEGMPIPIMPMAVAPHAAHLHQQGALPMYAEYQTTASAQGYGVPMHAMLPGMQQAQYQPHVQQQMQMQQQQQQMQQQQQQQMQHPHMQPSQMLQPQMQMYPSPMNQPPMQPQSTPRRHVQMQQQFPMRQPQMQQVQGQHTPRQQPQMQPHPMQQSSMKQQQMQQPGLPSHTPQFNPARVPTARYHSRRGGGNQPRVQNRPSSSSQSQASPDAQSSHQQPQQED